MINLIYTPTTPIIGNTKVKKEKNNVFSLFIESTNKNNKALPEAMDKTNTMQLEIEKGCSRLQF